MKSSPHKKQVKRLEWHTLYTADHEIPYQVQPDLPEIIEKINEIIDFITPLPPKQKRR